MLPTFRITPQISNGNDLDFLGGRTIEESKWKPMDKAAAKARGYFRPHFRVSLDSLHGRFHLG
jgi:hypothetical protein